MNAPDNLERRARALYREASRQIDPATAGKLRAARREALAAAAAPAHERFARMWCRRAPSPPSPWPR
jgi:hypothetical protein